MLGWGDTDERWKKLRATQHPSRRSHPPQTTAHVCLLMEPCTTCCLSNRNSGLFMTIIDDDFFFMLPCSASTIAQHPGWAPALKVRSRLLGAFSHHEAVPCIISKVRYLLPMPPDWCFLFGPAAWHALAKNPGQLHSPSRWLCFEYCKFKHLSHYDSNRSGAGMNVLLMPRRGFSQSYYKYHVAILYPALEDQHKWKRVSDYRRGRQGHDFHVEEGEVPHQTPPLCGGSRFKC